MFTLKLLFLPFFHKNRKFTYDCKSASNAKTFDAPCSQFLKHHNLANMVVDNSLKLNWVRKK